MYLDWATQARDYFAIDIETDDLDASKIWVMCWENIRTGERGECLSDEDIRSFFDRTKGSVYVGHNILKFDAPVLNRLVGTRLSLSCVVDTLVLSLLYRPSLEGGHSLEAWGQRFKTPKIEFSDWSFFRPEMVDYCRQDVAICVRLFKGLTATMNKLGFSERSCYIQHHFSHILECQHKNGFYFDIDGARSLYQELRGIETDIEQAVRRLFPPELKRVGVYKKAFKSDGSPTAQFLRHRDLFDLVVVTPDGGYEAFSNVEFNIGSPAQRVEKLLSLGWKPGPDELTETGKPQPFRKNALANSLEQLVAEKDIAEIRLIAKWLSVNGRANMINTWMENYNERTHCIHGKLYVADTLRLRHQSPNTANIPGVRLDEDNKPLLGEAGHWTYEARNLWTARPGRVLVGTDAVSLELRMLAHFLNNREFSKQVIEGDPHQASADAVGVKRSEAKTLLYASIYGAGPAKIAATLGVSKEEGDRVRTMFLNKLGLQSLMDVCKEEQERGRIWLVDGSGVVCSSPHASLNYKLQGSGARLMALSAIFLARYIRADGLDSLKVGDIHDEWQFDVASGDAQRHAERSVQAIRDAAEELNLNLPFDGKAKAGLTWAQTH